MLQRSSPAKCRQNFILILKEFSNDQLASIYHRIIVHSIQIYSIAQVFYQIRITGIAKILNDIIETYWGKGLPPAQTIKALKETFGRSGVYKVVKRITETLSCIPKVRSTPERSGRTKKLIGTIRKKLKRNPGKSARKLLVVAHASRLTVQILLKDDLKVKSYKIIKRQLLSDATKKRRLERSKLLLNKLRDDKQPQALWTDEQLFSVQASHNSQNGRLWIQSIGSVLVQN